MFWGGSLCRKRHTVLHRCPCCPDSFYFIGAAESKDFFPNILIYCVVSRELKKYYLLFLLFNLNLSLYYCKSVWLLMGRYGIEDFLNILPQEQEFSFLKSSVRNFRETMSYSHFPVV